MLESITWGYISCLRIFYNPNCQHK